MHSTRAPSTPTDSSHLDHHRDFAKSVEARNDLIAWRERATVRAGLPRRDYLPSPQREAAPVQMVGQEGEPLSDGALKGKGRA